MNKYHFTALILGSGLALTATAMAGPGCEHEGKAGRGPGARFSQIDADGDGKVSLAELTASRESWLTRVDVNEDGVATREELTASFEAGRQQRLQNMFSREDVNRDGRLTREETRLPSAWFERADADDDGALTLAELADARKKAGPAKEKRAAKQHRLDQNGDGKIESAEVQSAVAAQFARLDRNQDGSLTQDEFRSGRRHGRHRHGGKGAPDGATPAPAPTRS